MNDLTRLKDLVNKIHYKFNGRGFKTIKVTSKTEDLVNALLDEVKALKIPETSLPETSTPPTLYERYLGGEALVFKFDDRFIEFCNDKFWLRKDKQDVPTYHINQMIPIKNMKWDVYNIFMTTVQPQFQIKLFFHPDKIGEKCHAIESTYYCGEETLYLQHLEFFQKLLKCDHKG